MNEWQRVEMASRDGSRVLGRQEDGQIEVMWFSQVDGQWVYGDFFGFNPIHWMPLPKAPECSTT